MPVVPGLYPKPNRSPAQRVRFGKEEQRHERALTFEKSRSKRYKACSDVEHRNTIDATTLRMESTAGTKQDKTGLTRGGNICHDAPALIMSFINFLFHFFAHSSQVDLT